MQFYQNALEEHEHQTKPTIIHVKEPPIGNKVTLIKERGLFVLETGPAMLRAMACTHAGSGGFTVYDGVPDEHGWFPKETTKIFRKDFKDEQEFMIAQEIERQNQNGRDFYYAQPACMGMWMLDAGCNYGITVENLGASGTSVPIITVTWMSLAHRNKAMGK